MATKEQIYKEQMQALGIYDPVFDPMIKELAQKERRRKRLQDAWSATAPPGGKPSFLDPLYEKLVQAERDIRDYRAELGLTPKALRRLRGTPEAPVQQDLITDRLNAITERVKGYGMPDMSKLDTREDGSPTAFGGAPFRQGGQSGPSRTPAPTDEDEADE